MHLTLVGPKSCVWHNQTKPFKCQQGETKQRFFNYMGSSWRPWRIRQKTDDLRRLQAADAMKVDIYVCVGRKVWLIEPIIPTFFYRTELILYLCVGVLWTVSKILLTCCWLAVWQEILVRRSLVVRRVFNPLGWNFNFFYIRVF